MGGGGLEDAGFQFTSKLQSMEDAGFQYTSKLQSTSNMKWFDKVLIHWLQFLLSDQDFLVYTGTHYFS